MDAQKGQLTMSSGLCIPTLNQAGTQMATCSPLWAEWIGSFNETDPLLDLGCAFCINTRPALDLGIPVIALDMEEGHLDILQQNVSSSHSHLLSCVLGSLPNDIALEDSSVSGILLAEVLHFMNETEIEPALKMLFQKLVPGGHLFITTMSIHYHVNVDDSVVEEFYRKRAIGVKWPGIILCTAEYWDNLAKSVNCSGDKIAFWRAKPEFGHCTDIEQLTEDLLAVGFEIRRAKECQHPGYPACVRNNGRANIQVIARKPIES